jgi:hypothetical protein
MPARWAATTVDDKSATLVVRARRGAQRTSRRQRNPLDTANSFRVGTERYIRQQSLSVNSWSVTNGRH